MKRQVVLDTETTGLEAAQGHRIIEIGCVELVNRRRTEKTFHRYLNPERDIEEGAVDVHGIRAADLVDKPRFREIVEEFLDFIRGSEVIIHNAEFDKSFINRELEIAGAQWGRMEDVCSVFDSLQLARQMHPGQKNSLDALCQRYAVDNSGRELHGALLDARILSDVYLAMTGGQVSLTLDDADPGHEGVPGITSDGGRRRPLRVIAPTPEELAAHRLRLQGIERAAGRCLWRDASLDSD